MKNLRFNFLIMPGNGSPFSEQERIWIVKTFGEEPSEKFIYYNWIIMILVIIRNFV